MGKKAKKRRRKEKKNRKEKERKEKLGKLKEERTVLSEEPEKEKKDKFSGNLMVDFKTTLKQTETLADTTIPDILEHLKNHHKAYIAGFAVSSIAGAINYQTMQNHMPR